MPRRPTHGPNRLAAATANGAAPATGFGRGPARSAAATPPPRRRLEPQSPRRSRASSPLPLTATPRARRRQTSPAPTTSMRSRPPRLDGGKWSGGSVRRRSAEKHARRRPSKAGQPERTRGSARALPKRHAISREQTPHTARAAESGPQPYAVIHCRSSDDIRNDGGRPRPIVNTVDWLPQWHRREAA